MKKLKEESENEIHVRQKKKGDIKGLIKEVAKMKGCFFNKLGSVIHIFTLTYRQDKRNDVSKR